MQEKSKDCPAEGEDPHAESPAGDEKPSYYYDDAHGYEVFDPTNEDEEDDEPSS
jgi:hypothetical protein